MKRSALALVAAFAIWSGPAFASQCPVDMAKVDAALVTAAATLSAEELAKVKKLCAKGEAKHYDGNHEKSVKVLAKAILGIE